jgi:hypothetical protein
MEAPLTESNYLPELAGRIRAEDTAVADALKDSLRHAITASRQRLTPKNICKHFDEHAPRRGDVDTLDMRVCHGRAQHEGMRHSR